jgi:hypothetical protein
MSSLFCCSNTQGYKNKGLTHDAYFTPFLNWAKYPRESNVDTTSSVDDPAYAIQLVKQVNYGPLESKRYFIINTEGNGENEFVEVTENWLIEANFQKLNA